MTAAPRGRWNAWVAFALAVVVTAVVTIPLAVLANRADPTARGDGLLVTQGDEAQEADGATLDANRRTIVSWDDRNIVGATYVLFIDGVEAAQGQAAGTQPLLLANFDEPAMVAGTYELLATGTTGGGEEVRRAAIFVAE